MQIVNSIREGKMGSLLKTHKIKEVVHDTKGQQVSKEFMLALETFIMQIVVKSSIKCRFKRMMADDLMTKL